MKNLITYIGIFLIGAMMPIPNLEVDGYTKLGSNAPAVKMKRIGFLYIDLHDNYHCQDFPTIGIDHTKIISFDVIVETSDIWTSTNDNSPGREFTAYFTTGHFCLRGVNGNSFLLKNVDVQVTFFYRE